MTSRKASTGVRCGKQGTVLVLIIMVILTLSTVSIVSYSLLLTELEISRNQVKTSRSLFQADSGVKYVKRQVEAGLESGLALSNVLANLEVAAPEGLVFDPVDEFRTVVEERLFEVEVTGRSASGQTTVEASLRRKDAFQAGIFGHRSVEFFPGAGAWAYDTRVHRDPVLSMASGLASVGSNGAISMNPNSVVDGSFILGGSETGHAAACENCGSNPVLDVGYIDPDPLGLNGGGLAETMAQVKLQNDNHRETLIHHNRLAVRPHKSAALSSGNYYLSSLQLKSGSTLTIDSSSGPVRVFVESDMRIWPNAEVNHDGLPGDFQVITPIRDEIKILPNGDYTGLIYAPNAEVRIMPNGDYRGVVWSNKADVKPSGAAFIDIALLEQFVLNELVIQHWKELRTN